MDLLGSHKEGKGAGRVAAKRLARMKRDGVWKWRAGGKPSYDCLKDCFWSIKWGWMIIFFLACAQPPIYSQECLCWADTSQRVALSWPALFCLIMSAASVEHMTDSCLVEQMTSLTPCISVPTSPPLVFSSFRFVPVSIGLFRTVLCIPAWYAAVCLRKGFAKVFLVLAPWIWARNDSSTFKESIQRFPVSW